MKTFCFLRLAGAALLLFLLFLAGCKTTAPAESPGRDETLEAFSAIPLKNDFPYVLTEDLAAAQTQSDSRVFIAALINLDTGKNPNVMNYSVGSFSAKKDGNVTLNIFSEPLTLRSMGEVCREVEKRRELGAVGFFMMVDGVLLSRTENESAEVSENFARFFESNLQKAQIPYAFLIPNHLQVLQD